MILHHPDQQRIQQNQCMRGGTGTVIVRHLLEAPELDQKGRLFAEITVPPQASIGPHTHEGETETFYFTRGRGEYLNNLEKIPVQAGDVVKVDNNNAHSVTNTGTEPLVMIALILFA